MTDTQLYLSIGIPTLAVILGMLGNGLLFNALSARMSSMEARMISLETRMDARMLALETSMTARFDLIMGRLADLATRLSVLEDRWKR